MAPMVIGSTPIGKLTGPWILGVMWSYFFYGILSVQVYVYVVHFNSKDPIGIKLTVACLFLLETLFTIFCTLLAYKTFGSGWGDIDVLIMIDWSWLVTPILNGLTELTAQTFYIWRIWKLTRNIWLAGFIQSISLLSCISIIYFDTKFIALPLFPRLIDQNTMIVVWLSSAATCDVLITGTFVVYLQSAKNRTALSTTTRTLLNKILTYTIETGMLTTAVATIELVLWLTAHQFNYHFIWYLTIARLYANALMATLNSRVLIMLDGQSRKSDQSIGAGSGLWADRAGFSSITSSRGIQPLMLNITTEQTSYVHQDEILPVGNPKEMEMDVLNNS